MSVGTAGAIAIAGGVAAAGSIGGSLISSSAASSAGQLQYQVAQQQLALAQQALQTQIQNRASGIAQAQTAAQMSPSEIANINGMLTTQTSSLNSSMANLQKMQSQLSAMDPQVQAAGQNFYNLLTGQSAAILAPLQQQQQMQRQQMQNQLAASMGPGWATSSAGIQAMVQFDNQAAITTNQAQMQALQTVGSQYMATAGMQEQGQYGIGSQQLNAYGQSIATQGQAAGAYAQNTGLQTNATLGAMSANQINPFGVPNAAQSMVNTAPGMFAGQAQLGQGVGQLAGGIGGTIGMMGTMNAMQGYNSMMQQGFGAMLSGGSVPSAGGAAAGAWGGANGGYSTNIGAGNALASGLEQ